MDAEERLARERDWPASVAEAAMLDSQCSSPVRLPGMGQD